MPARSSVIAVVCEQQRRRRATRDPLAADLGGVEAVTRRAQQLVHACEPVAHVLDAPAQVAGVAGEAGDVEACGQAAPRQPLDLLRQRERFRRTEAGAAHAGVEFDQHLGARAAGAQGPREPLGGLAASSATVSGVSPASCARRSTFSPPTAG